MFKTNIGCRAGCSRRAGADVLAARPWSRRDIARDVQEHPPVAGGIAANRSCIRPFLLLVAGRCSG
ncbi:hypothetical protein, partial [Microbacterium oxydans]|uniref:hypothetical protein n=1 Tax=Microbacterium oxydans TaxID=82380 RepID=UPI001E2872B3